MKSAFGLQTRFPLSSLSLSYQCLVLFSLTACILTAPAGRTFHRTHASRRRAPPALTLLSTPKHSNSRHVRVRQRRGRRRRKERSAARVFRGKRRAKGAVLQSKVACVEMANDAVKKRERERESEGEKASEHCVLESEAEERERECVSLCASVTYRIGCGVGRGCRPPQSVAANEEKERENGTGERVFFSRATDLVCVCVCVCECSPSVSFRLLPSPSIFKCSYLRFASLCCGSDAQAVPLMKRRRQRRSFRFLQLSVCQCVCSLPRLLPRHSLVALRRRCTASKARDVGGAPFVLAELSHPLLLPSIALPFLLVPQRFSSSCA